MLILDYIMLRKGAPQGYKPPRVMKNEKKNLNFAAIEFLF